MLRTCPKCEVEKDIILFRIVKGKYKNPCKECKNKGERERRAKDPEKRNAKSKEEYRRKKEKIAKMEIEIDPNETKTCTKCNTDKPLTEFYTHAGKGNIRAECKECASKDRKQHYQNNRKNVIKQTTQYKLNRMKVDPAFKLEIRLRARIYSAFTSQGQVKKERTREYLECTPSYFKRWMKYQLYDGMTMDNYGWYWHIDHVIPCASFDLTKEEDIKKCFHWSNCRPYVGSKNSSKRNKIIPHDILMQGIKSYVFKKSQKPKVILV